MGSASSMPLQAPEEDPFWAQGRKCNSESFEEQSSSNTCEVQSDHVDSYEDRTRKNAQKLEEYRKDYAKKHAERREIIAAKKQEMVNLRDELIQLRKENEGLKKELETQRRGSVSLPENVHTCNCNVEIDSLKTEIEELKSKNEQYEQELRQIEDISNKNKELQKLIAETQQELQHMNSEVVSFEKERHDYRVHVVALKDVIRVSKQMLQIREAQMQELKEKVAEIEANLSRNELVALSNDLRQEYEKQLRNIKYLKALYQDKERVLRTDRDSIKTQLEDSTRELQKQQTMNTELEERVNELEKANSDKYDTINSLQSNLGLSQAECRGLRAEMNVINQLFSQILVGFNNGQDIDLDKLIKVLEENHDLLTDIVFKEESSETSSAMPKVLLDLVNQMHSEDSNEEEEENYAANDDIENCDQLDADENDKNCSENTDSNFSSQQTLSSAQEIVQNLPKVWRVLVELLSHQNCPSVNIPEEENSPEEGQDKNPCYKSVQTPTGSRLVLSVSKTYIRLKDLILEKKSLEKETNRLKHLNSHLEGRLQDQEKRLEMVSNELSKTWHVVGKMQRQHQQLHTHEQVLCYELAQKRKLLNELKIELEYAREKWTQAREKNSTTEEQWKQLRTEFALRKANHMNDDLNNSAESGYSDEREGSSDDEPGYETDVSVSEKPEQELVSPAEPELLSPAEPAERVEESLHSKTLVQEGDETKTDLVQNIEEKTNSTKSITQTSLEITNEQNTSTDNKEEQSTSSTISCEENLQKSDEIKSGEEMIAKVVHEQENIEEQNISTDNAEEQSISATASSQENPQKSDKIKSAEEMIARRNERLKRLEAQCKQLVTKVTNTSQRSAEISSKLDNLHEQFGSSSSSLSSEESSVTESQLPETQNDSNNTEDGTK